MFLSWGAHPYSSCRVAPIEVGQTSIDTSYTQTLGSAGCKRAATGIGRGENWGASTWGIRDGRPDSSSSVGDCPRCPRVRSIKPVAIRRRPRPPIASCTTKRWRYGTSWRRTGRKRSSGRDSTGPCSPFKIRVISSIRALGKPRGWGSDP